jgi:uncharacterized protein (TIGR03437 family)
LVLNRILLLLLAGLAASGQSSLSDSAIVWQRSLDMAGGQSLAVDNEGNSYVFGPANVGFVSTNPPYGAGGPRSAVIKLDPLGNVVWSTVLHHCIGFALILDSAKNVYIAGSADGDSFPTTPGAFQTRLSNPQPFAAKLNPNGLLEWATLLGGRDGSSAASAIAVDATGVYVAGSVGDDTFPTTPGAFQETAKTTSGPGTLPGYGFIAKLNPTGSALLFSTLLGGTAGANALSGVDKIAIDNNGAVYALGTSSSPDFPVTSGAYQSVGRMFLAKLNPSGSGLLFSTFVAGAEVKVSGNVTVDGDQNAYIALSADPDPQDAATPARVLKINPTGTASVYDRLIEGSSYIGLGDLTVDSSGNVIVSGFTAAPDVPIPAACFESSSGFPAANPNFILSINSSGEIADGGYLPFAPGGVGSNVSVKMDSIGNIYTADWAGAIVVRKLAQGRGALGPVHLGCVANHGTLLKSPVAPGEVVELFGDGIGPAKAASLQLDASGKVSNVLSNTQVFFNGIPAPLTYAQSKQINAVVPWGIAGRKTTEICVAYVGLFTNCLIVPVSEVSPGFLRMPSGSIATLNEDSSINTPNNPAKVGSIVTLYVTGTGPSAPPESDGEVIQEVRPGALAVEVSFFRLPAYLFDFGVTEVPAEVILHCPAPALVSGVEVIQVRVPTGVRSNVTLRMRSSTGETFEDAAYIYVTN